MNNLVKMTRSAYSTAKTNRTLVCPNVALISDENKVEFLPMNPTSDIGIAAYENGLRTYYSLEEWNALTTKPTAIGVYMFTEQSQFVIHGTILSGKWSDTTEVAVDGVTTTTSTALLDFKGKENTDAVIGAVSGGDITNAPIFTSARALTCADANAVFSVAAAGQVELMRLNATAINACRTALSQTTINFGSNVWSSTQYSASHAWFWHGSFWDIIAKFYSFSGVAVAAI